MKLYNNVMKQKLNRERRKTDLMVGINPTPLIDVMFLLTIFFMLTSTIIKTSSINVNLPKSVTSDVQPQTQLVITITRDNQIYLNDVKVRIDDIPSVVKRVTVQSPNIPVIIRGDRSVEYQTIVDVMDKVRIGGGTEISLSVEGVR